MMDKDDELYSIGQVSQLLNVKEHTIRFWEKEFPFVNPIRKSNGRREYTKEDFALLQRIKKLLYEEGYTTKGALKELINLSQRHSPNLSIHDSLDLFSDEVFSSSSTKKKSLQDVINTNKESNQALSKIQKNRKKISQKIDKTLWKKLYQKVDRLIEYLEEK